MKGKDKKDDDKEDGLSVKKKVKSRDNEYRKQRKEERALKFLQDQHPEIKPSYKKGFNHLCGNAQGRKYTVSIALPGSILDNAQNFEAKNNLIGQIARTLSVFSIDEVVIYDEACNLPELENDDGSKEIDQATCIETLLTTQEDYDPNVLMAFILKYLETPQYLRKILFEFNDCLGKAGLLPPLAIPSHQRSTDKFPYREGIVVSENPDDKSIQSSNLIEIGLDEPIKLKDPLAIDSRITVKRNHNKFNDTESWELCDRDEPRIRRGAYWGYRIRITNGISGALKNCTKFYDSCSPSDKKDENHCKYDLIIGTSEVGSNVDKYQMPKFKHLLIVFGGVQGIEHAISQDSTYPENTEAKSLFSAYLNTCPVQGSRTIRTEEAIPITLSILRPNICNKGKN